MLHTRQNNNNGQMRLDSGEQLWLRRELEWVDEQIYETIYEENIARQIIPIKTDVPEWAGSFSYSELSAYGKAKIVSNFSDDIPRVGLSRGETLKAIKMIADAYGWTIMDIKRSAATGVHLDTELAKIARRSAETEIDRILAVGDTDHNLDGILKLDTVGSITPIVATTKTGGGTNWSAASLPSEWVADIVKLIEATITKLKGARNAPIFRKWRIVLPDTNFIRLTTRKIGDYDTRTPYQFLKEIPYVEEIFGWHRAVGAAANNVDDRIAIFPYDPSVVAGVVPMDWTPQEPEKRNLEYVVACLASCGGVFSRVPVGVGYMDTIDAT